MVLIFGTIIESFYLSNISPQTPEFNRFYWLKLENHIRDLAKQFKEIQVYSGCAYLPIKDKEGKGFVKHRVIGTNSVSVPTHYFKAVFSKEGKPIEAYIIPNKDIDLETPLEDFKTTIEKIENVAGILFIR